MLSEDETPTNVLCITGTPVSESEIEALLLQTTRNCTLGNFEDEEELPICLAGAQEKFTLL